MIGIIENVINILGNILILVLEILLVVVIGNAGIQAVLDFDGDDFIRKAKRMIAKLRR